MKINLDNNEYEILDHFYFTKGHEWAYFTSDTINGIEKPIVIVGISDYFQFQLGEISFVELMPHIVIGTSVNQALFLEPNENSKTIRDVTIESAKTVINIHAPVSGKIIQVNLNLEQDPELLNKSPYEDGWLLIIEPNNLEEEIKNLMSGSEYITFLKNL